jgi:hypothetical protein
MAIVNAGFALQALRADGPHWLQKQTYNHLRPYSIANSLNPSSEFSITHLSTQ